MTSSVYEYITVSDLESYAGTDYSAVDAGYTDTVIEACISLAERMVNAYCGQSFTGTIPDAIISVVLDLSYKIMFNRLLNDGAIDRENFQKRYDIGIFDEQKMLLDRVKTNSIYGNFEFNGDYPYDRSDW